MKSMRYIVTRPCLQEGSLSLLKYLEDAFPQSGPAVFVDDKGEEHAVQVDTERRRVWGLGGLYHAQHLGVNDVLTITNLAPARYQVEAIVKPHAPPAAPRREEARPPETRRVVVNSTAHVREVRTREWPARPETAQAGAGQPAEMRVSGWAAAEPRETGAHTAQAQVAENYGAENHVAEGRGPENRTAAHRVAEPRPAAPPLTERHDSQSVSEVRSASPRAASPQSLRSPAPAQVVASTVPAAAPSGPVGEIEEAAAQLRELARLSGYRVQQLGGGAVRLSAELGAHGYSVLVALNDAARQTPVWKEQADYRVLLTTEAERPQGVSRLTREALAALIEHAQLAPLSAVDLRGYWKAGNVDLDSAASVAELVSAHLAQRGAFSFVLLTLAQQPAHTVISVPRLAERLGSGVNLAELGSILETLSRAPFMALTPLPGNQYLLRVGVGELLSDLAEYAEGVGRRVKTPTRENVLS